MLYNFEEGEEIDSKGNIAKIIKDKNEEEKNFTSKDPKDYFLIMKINIPFFNDDEFALYSNFFELMDIPGLNDGGEEEYYIKKLFPYFINNSKFCFFVFDAEEYQNIDSQIIFNKISELFEDKENIYKNSIIILNKVDLVEKEKESKNFEQYLKDNLKIKKFEYICCNSKLLHLNNFKLQSFLNYLEYIFSKEMSENNINNDLNDYIVCNINEDFEKDINIYSNEQFNADEEEKKEFEEYLINENIPDTYFQKLDDINNYIYYKRIFDKIKNEIKESEEIKKIELKIKNKILNSCKTIFDSYLDFKQFNDLKDEISEKCHINLNEKKINVKNPFKIDQRKIFDSFKEIVEKLISLKDHEYTRTIRDEFKFIESFIQNEIKIRIPILGCYSSGKSLLLNNLIGYDILPVGKGIMTKIGIVINYTDSINKICLKKTFLTKSKNFLEEYQFFDDEKDFIYSKFENMKEILKLLNISYSYGDEFVDLIINYIKRFDEITLNASFQEISETIEKIILNKNEEEYNQLMPFILGSLKDEYKNIDLIKEMKIAFEKIVKGSFQWKKNQKQKELFLKLIIPIKILDEIKLDNDTKKRIELIDIPGLNTKEQYLEDNTFGNLIKFSNGFLFVSKKSATGENSNKDIIFKLVYKIRNRKMLDFNFNSLFFILTNCESSLKKNIEDKKKDIKNSININDIIINQNIKDESEFLISDFSNINYNKYLEYCNKSEDINNFYNFLKTKNIKIGKFLNELKNKNYKDYKPSENDLKECKSKLPLNINIEDNFISQYLFLRKNLSSHLSLEKSNYLELQENISKLIESSKKLLDESLKRGIVNFIIYLKDKLEKIYFPNNLKDMDIGKINEELNNLVIIIRTKIDNFEKSFRNEIGVLEVDILNRRKDETEIMDFSSNWKIKKDTLVEEIKGEIVKVYTEINEFKILKNSEYEKNKFFTKNHILIHVGAGGAHILSETTIILLTSFYPFIAIAIGVGVLIHGGICFGKFIRDKINHKEDLVKQISKYKEVFIDNLKSYENELNEFLKLQKNIQIREINDKNMVYSLELNDKERKEFNEIYSLFKKKIDLFFNYE